MRGGRRCTAPEAATHVCDGVAGSELCKFGVVSTGAYMRRAGSSSVRDPSCPGAANWKSPLSPVRGFRRSAWGLGMPPPPAPGPSERPTRGRCVSDHSHLACDHSHATITDSRRESGSFNTESPYPMRAAPQGPTWWPPVIGGPFLIHSASNKIAQAEQLPHLLINDGAHDECGHEAQAVDAPTSIEAEWAICAPNVSDALQRACR